MGCQHIAWDGEVELPICYLSRGEAVEHLEYEGREMHEPRLINDKRAVMIVDTRIAWRGMFHPDGTTSSQLENGTPASEALV